MENKINSKTLREVLFKNRKTQIEFNSTLVLKIEKILDKKISDLTESDIRLLVNQSFGLQYIVPMAIDLLEKDLFIECDYYEGDLLLNLLNIDNTYWINQKDQFKRLKEIMSKGFNNIDQIIFDEEIKNDLVTKYANLIENS